jgi:hypothetical protein
MIVLQTIRNGIAVVMRDRIFEDGVVNVSSGDRPMPTAVWRRPSAMRNG